MGVEIGQEAPDFALKDQHGDAISLAALRGDKARFLVSWEAPA